jgi:hypothetical protein
MKKEEREEQETKNLDMLKELRINHYLYIGLILIFISIIVTSIINYQYPNKNSSIIVLMFSVVTIILLGIINSVNYKRIKLLTPKPKVEEYNYKNISVLDEITIGDLIRNYKPKNEKPKKEKKVFNDKPQKIPVDNEEIMRVKLN